MTTPLSITIYNPSDKKMTYTLTHSFDDSVDCFITTQDGEGMGIDYQKLFDVIDKWFKESM